MSFDFEKISQSKAAYRRKLADLPIAEKLRLLDALRERAVILRPPNTASESSSRTAEPSAQHGAKQKEKGD